MRSWCLAYASEPGDRRSSLAPLNYWSASWGRIHEICAVHWVPFSHSMRVWVPPLPIVSPPEVLRLSVQSEHGVFLPTTFTLAGAPIGWASELLLTAARASDQFSLLPRRYVESPWLEETILGPRLLDPDSSHTEYL